MKQAGAALLLLAMVLPGSAHAQEQEKEQESANDQEKQAAAPSDAVEDILKAPDAEGYGDSPRCLSTTRIRDVSVIDSQHISFRTGRDSYYLVQFKRRCPQLRRGSTISHDNRGGRLCQLDTIRAVDIGGFGSRTGPPCQIPGFTPITRAQLALLKERLKEARKGDLIDEFPEEESGDADAGA